MPRRPDGPGYSALEVDEEEGDGAALLGADKGAQHPWDAMGVHHRGRRWAAFDGLLSPRFLMWWYVLPLLRTHLTKRFDFEHLWPLPSGSSTAELLPRWETAQRQLPDATMGRLLFHLFGRRWLKAGCVYLLWWCCVGLQPWLMASLTDYLVARTDSPLPGIAYSFALCNPRDPCPGNLGCILLERQQQPSCGQARAASGTA